MKDVIQLVDEETTFQEVIDKSPIREFIISAKPDEPKLVGKWTKTFKFFSHIKYGSRRLVQACFTYDHQRNIKVGSFQDHVSSFLQSFCKALYWIWGFCKNLRRQCPEGFEPIFHLKMDFLIDVAKNANAKKALFEGRSSPPFPFFIVKMPIIFFLLAHFCTSNEGRRRDAFDGSRPIRVYKYPLQFGW